MGVLLGLTVFVGVGVLIGGIGQGERQKKHTLRMHFCWIRKKQVAFWRRIIKNDASPV
jgi:hypothetical protein